MTETQPPAHRKPLVLIVDDILDNVELLGEALSADYDVQFATSGPQALALLQDTLHDLILLDVMMPGMDGYEVCARLKSQPRTRNVPVIFVTAKSDSESETKALQAGAADFIHKPVNLPVLRARVATQLMLQAEKQRYIQVQAELEQRVLERTQALRDSLALAQAASQAKASLLANMSHEIRTPLNAILGMSFLLKRQMSDPQDQQRLSRIEGAGRRLLDLLNGVLDLSRLEGHAIALEVMEFELSSVIGVAIDALQHRARAKELQIVQQIDPHLPENLSGDPLRLGQALQHLLDNAIKFSPAGGQIQLRVQLKQQIGAALVTRFEVQDHGIGISPDQVGKIFDLFEQVDSSPSRSFEGMGLGLPICRHLAELMDGQVGVDSRLGVGSTFWLTVPLGQVAPTQNAVDAITNWTALKQVVGYLVALLSEDDAAAQTLWREHADQLAFILQAGAAEFTQAMESYDFDAAISLLLTAVSRWPELQHH